MTAPQEDNDDAFFDLLDDTDDEIASPAAADPAQTSHPSNNDANATPTRSMRSHNDGVIVHVRMVNPHPGRADGGECRGRCNDDDDRGGCVAGIVSLSLLLAFLARHRN